MQQLTCKFILLNSDDLLLVGTHQGHLLMYSILQGPGGDGQVSSSSKCEVHLLRSNKYFAKKPIQQLAVVPEHQILISLSGNILKIFLQVKFHLLNRFYLNNNR